MFCSDLDNTLIYSCRREMDFPKSCVEVYEGREVSFMSERTRSLLEEARKKAVFVPTTTRSTEQYRRVDFGVGKIGYALVCNGGVLLVDGGRDEEWYKKSLELIFPSMAEIERAFKILSEESSRNFEVRFVEELFLFTKCENPDFAVRNLKDSLDSGLVDVLRNGKKVYVVPKPLNKGDAILRLKSLLNPERTVAAGDSEFDVPMLKNADFAFVPIRQPLAVRQQGRCRCQRDTMQPARCVLTLSFITTTAISI